MMVLFAILAFILLFLIGFVVLGISAIGSVGIIIFSDVIVCIAIIVVIMRLLFKNRKK